MNQSKLLLVPVFFLTFAINLFSQSVELKYRERTIGSDLVFKFIFQMNLGMSMLHPILLLILPIFIFVLNQLASGRFLKKILMGMSIPLY